MRFTLLRPVPLRSGVAAAGEGESGHGEDLPALLRPHPGLRRGWWLGVAGLLCGVVLFAVALWSVGQQRQRRQIDAALARVRHTGAPVRPENIVHPEPSAGEDLLAWLRELDLHLEAGLYWEEADLDDPDQISSLLDEAHTFGIDADRLAAPEAFWEHHGKLVSIHAPPEPPDEPVDLARLFDEAAEAGSWITPELLASLARCGTIDQRAIVSRAIAWRSPGNTSPPRYRAR